MIPDTPQTLLKRIREFRDGDDATEWSRFVELYTPVIRQFVMFHGEVPETDADDIVQDIFVRLVDVLRGGRYCSGKGRFRTYLATMIRRLLIDRYRRAQVRGGGREVPLENLELLADYPDVAAIVDARLRLAGHAAAVEHVLTKTMLDTRTVAAYRDYAIKEEPAVTVAARHGMSVNTLRQIKFRVNQMIAAVEESYWK